MGIVDRVRDLPTGRVAGMDAWIAAQKNPEAVRKEVVDALMDPTISYRALWRVLRADGLTYKTPDSLRNWWMAQPEFVDGLR
jgi:hypothetical protein